MTSYVEKITALRALGYSLTMAADLVTAEDREKTKQLELTLLSNLSPDEKAEYYSTKSLVMYF